MTASFDAAQTSHENARHWAAADALSADAGLILSTRVVLRNRARYEVANNPYARGIINTLASDTIGTGPRLQMNTGEMAINKVIEQRWNEWCQAIRFAEKLTVGRKSRCHDGEVFYRKVTNPGVRSRVQLDLQAIECDQVSSPFTNQTMLVDGIVLDEFGNPKAYHVLKDHPGSLIGAAIGQYEEVPASDIIHWFRPDRPGQHRGIPEITPSLPLFACLRRWTLATVASSEWAASQTVFFRTTAPPEEGAAEIDMSTTLDVERGTGTFVPEGWEPFQMKAEHPTSVYSDFKHELLNEIARPFSMPYNIAACNSSGYNYSSGRLDHQLYFKSIRIDRAMTEIAVIDPVFEAWFMEAVLLSDYLPVRARVAPRTHTWMWDGFEDLDPAKSAAANAQALASRTTTLQDVWAAKGYDWSEKLQQIADERKLMQQLGIPESQAPVPNGTQKGADDVDEEPKPNAAGR